MTATATLDQIEDQKLFEVSAVERGAKRLAQKIADGTLADSPAGHRIIKEVLEPLTAAIRTTQEAVLAPGRGMPPPWADLIVLVEPDVAAYVVLNGVVGNLRANKTGRGVASYAADCIRLQVEFDLWRARSKAAYKSGEVETDVAGDILRRFGPAAVTPRDFKRWQRKLGDCIRLQWPFELKVQLGAKLLELLALNCGQWFEVRKVWKRGKTEYIVQLTDIAKEAIDDLHTNAGLSAPLYLPMTCPPRPWETVDAVQ